MGAAVPLWAPVSWLGEPTLAWTWVVEELCDLYRLNVERLRQWVKFLSLVGAARALGWPLGWWEGLMLGVPSSCCLGDHRGGGWDVAASPPSHHPFGAGCQGFHRVTQILSI